MKRITFLYLFVFLFFSCKHVVAGNLEKDEYETLMERIREKAVNNPNVEDYLQRFDTTTGAFTDVDYSKRDRTNWEPFIHVQRLSDMAFAYTHPANTYFEDDAVHEMIVKGLDYWYERNPHCNNWWYNQIAEPQHIGLLLVQMRTGKKGIPADVEERTLERMTKEGGNPAKWTGANRADIGLHWIYRACLQKNESDLHFALENIYSPLVYTTKEGFQHDNSYFQHGQQLYIGGYGDAILQAVLQVGIYTHGTQFALNQEQIGLLSKFLRGTYYKTIRGKYMMFGVLGRGMSRPDATNKGGSIHYAQQMMVLDPEHATEYQEIIARLKGDEKPSHGIKPKHTHYFRGDYTLHVRPDYTFDVRMVSDRTLRCEYGNGENLKTYFVSDGCTNIVTAGDEYANIFPVWDWNKIPGVTAPLLDTIPRAKVDWQTRGTVAFAGGVSDSLYGASAYDYSDYYADINTKAKKAWFFFDDEIVCLGAGITSTAEAPIFTTINQSLLAGQPITIGTGKKVMTAVQGSSSMKDISWVHHNNIGYVFPQGGMLSISNQMQGGSWYDINRTKSDKFIEKDIFTLGFEHGTRPQNGNYAYIVIPNIASPKALQKHKINHIAILENNEQMQIVHHKKLDIWHIVFYEAGTYSSKELTVSADKPCIVQLKNINSSDGRLHIADPTQSQQLITLQVSIPERKIKNRDYTCNFENTSVYAGQSLVLKL